MRKRLTEHSSSSSTSPPINNLIIPLVEEKEDDSNTGPKVTNNSSGKGQDSSVSCTRLLCEGLLCSILTFLVAISYFWYFHNDNLNRTSPKALLRESNSMPSSARRATAPKCTEEQLAAIRKQINPNSQHCLENVYEQQCPITKATSCYDPTWLHTYYSLWNPTEDNSGDFRAVTIGCNQGFQPLYFLRLGTRDPSVDNHQWKTKLGKKASLPCQREQALLTHSSTTDKRVGHAYCLEESGDKVEDIRRTSRALAYEAKGLHVHLLPPSSKNSLDHFLQAHVLSPTSSMSNTSSFTIITSKTGSNQNVIHIMDVEVGTGEEFQILTHDLSVQTLNRTQYVSYKYDWKGGWSGYGRNTRIITNYLDQIGFTCYWAGMGKLWRITSCPSFPKEYSEAYKYWAHVACVHRTLAPKLLQDIMEQTFLNTTRSI